MGRALAHVEKIAWIKPIEGADNIELVGVLGWVCIARKEEFHEGDLCIYFEIDSKLPERSWSEFMKDKGYAVKTKFIKRFNVYSQGLAMPINSIAELVGLDLKEGDDLTAKLGITYYVEADNERKSDFIGHSDFEHMLFRLHLTKNRRVRKLTKKPWQKRLMMLLFGREEDRSYPFPAWIAKTDEERIENHPNLLGQENEWVVTEKIDGQSGTFALDLTRRKHQYQVFSRNKYIYPDSSCSYNTISETYKIENFLRNMASIYHCKRVVLQGECYGKGIQNNPYKMDAIDFVGFNLIMDGERKHIHWSRIEAWGAGIPWVPIVAYINKLPEDMERMKLMADGTSKINSDVKREGLVIRSADSQISFKNVSREYLLKHS